MTFNKDGSLRKKRVNRPTNFKWDEVHSTLAFCCYKAEANEEVLKQIAEKLGITLEAVRTRVREFITFAHRGRVEKVTELTETVFLKNNYRTQDECERKIEQFLENELDQNEEETEEELNELISTSTLIPVVETKAAITQIINNGVVDLGGKYLNSENLVVLQNSKSLNFIESASEGCYFIFSTLPLEKIPVMSLDGDKNYTNNYLIKDGVKYHCLYNGKANSVKERLKVHLFNSHTLEKVASGKADTISGTGAMSLVSVSEEEVTKLQSEKKYDPFKHKLKPVRKSIQPCSLDQREGHKYFLNGIDITEAPWNQYQFAVIVLRSDSEFGKMLIEEAFCVKNGRPPLCKRHG